MLKVITGKEYTEYPGLTIKFPEADMHPTQYKNWVDNILNMSEKFTINVVSYSSILIEVIEVVSKWHNIDVTYIVDNKEINENNLEELYDSLNDRVLYIIDEYHEAIDYRKHGDLYGY